ncbi:TetR/AcrR family transcriptional regulator [Paenibacillus sp. P96]|uniref:TetR/AcrR family transcriptional regulator n=1 Tax=Paenibacillus zeirhizosphaerae TaxID=2987519 RepID=A0ABT9FXS0_9BACL|nr:TetR/AcrR family transcriptional regulator [Paenibacillus sp. P96]MDP4099444.1 TetR/AcrR family transcriptional regulator [Paenibacillus sp. P96]
MVTDKVPAAGDDRRAQLMSIALKRFATYGYHQTKVSDIVSEAGVAQGTFYWYFKSKQVLALEIITEGRDQLLDAIGQGYRKDSGTLEDMVRASENLFTRMFDFAANHRYFMKLLLTGSGVDETVQRQLADTQNAMELAFRRNIRRAIELGMIPGNLDVELRAALLMSMIEGLMLRWLFGSEGTHDRIAGQSSSELAAEAANFEFYGLMGKP